MTLSLPVRAGLLAVVLLLLALPARAARDHLISVEWFADKTGTMGIEDVLQAPFEPRRFPVVEGFSDATHWFRIRVQADASGAPLHLRVGPNFLDDVLLYAHDPMQPGAWQTQVLGDRHPYSERSVLAIVPTFLLQPHGAEETYYLRVRSTSAILLIAEALTQADAAASDIRLHASTIFFALVMLTMLAWAIGTWVIERDRVLVAFIFVQLVYSLHVLVMGGFLLPVVSDASPWIADATLNMLTVLASFSLLVLNRALLRPCGLPRWGVWTIDIALFVLLPIALGLLLAGHARPALQASSLLMVLMVVVLPWLVLLVREEPPLGRRVLFTVILLQGLVLAASRLVIMGVLEGPFGSFAGLRVLSFGQGVISSGLLALYLLLRHRELRRHARESERAVLEHAARIEAMHEELERRAVQAEAGNRAKTAFLAIMGHEFRTPLNAITGYSEALLRDLPERRQRDLVERQVTAARTLQGMIDDVLDLASASADGSPDGRDFSPALLLTELRDRARERGQAKGLALVVELDPSLPASVHGDQARIARVLWHYIDNAIKFTQRGSITLAARRLPSESGCVNVRFDVRDTGPGIEPALRERLFTTFGPHEEYLKRQAGGAGLGLALARQLSIAMRGDAGCSSEPGKGSTFWLIVPLERAHGDVMVIEPLVPDPAEARVAAPSDLSPDDLQATVEELGELLRADDMRAARRFEELAPMLLAVMPGELLQRLRSDVESFDFAAAAATLGEWTASADADPGDSGTDVGRETRSV